MREGDAPKLSALAVDLMERSRVADLKADAAELSALIHAAQRPIPVLPVDPIERENVLTLLLLRERDRFRRILALVSGTSI